MFTGIVQAVGSVADLAASRLLVRAPSADYELGESIAVNGTCLTLVAETPDSEGPTTTLAFDLSEETLARTALGQLSPGMKVNLERAMSASSRFGGHIVQGHVDAVGELMSKRATEHAWVFRFRCEPAFDRYLIDKGSICIDGVSLTVVEPKDGEFDVWVIPHTLQNTSLGAVTPGGKVNLEFDVLAKYVEKLLASRG